MAEKVPKYVMCRRKNLKEMCNCKVIVNECIAKQHRMVVCKMALMVKKKKIEKVKPKIRWWKLKETSYQEAFRQEVTRILGGKDGLPDEWDKTAEMLRKTAETVLGMTFGKRKGDRETWWWNEKIQESIKKKEAKKAWYKIRNENTKKIYKEKKSKEKKAVAMEEERAYDDKSFLFRMTTPELLSGLVITIFSLECKLLSTRKHSP